MRDTACLVLMMLLAACNDQPRASVADSTTATASLSAAVTSDTGWTVDSVGPTEIRDRPTLIVRRRGAFAFGELGDSATALLQLTCLEGRHVGVYVLVVPRESPTGLVTWRLDQGRTQFEAWSSAGGGLLAPDGEEMAFALSRADTLRLEYVDHRDIRRLLRFDVRGLTPLLMRLFTVCGVPYRRLAPAR